MEKDEYVTEVIFRTERSGQFKGVVFALLPHECSDFHGHVTSYQHVGQHSSADYGHCIQTTRPATEAEYKDLKREMEGQGYNLKVIRKQNRDKFLKSYREVTKS